MYDLTLKGRYTPIHLGPLNRPVPLHTSSLHMVMVYSVPYETTRKNRPYRSLSLSLPWIQGPTIVLVLGGQPDVTSTPDLLFTRKHGFDNDRVLTYNVVVLDEIGLTASLCTSVTFVTVVCVSLHVSRLFVSAHSFCVLL